MADTLIEMKPETLAVALFVCTTLTAQTPTNQRLEGLDAHAKDLMQTFKTPGLAVAVVKMNKLVLARNYGFRDLSKKARVDGDTLFAIGSTTKAFTALGVALLAEDGELALDDTVRKHLPTFQLFDEYATNHMTVEDLLCHRSGLPRHDMAWYGSKRTRKQLFDALRFLPPNKPIRATWQYQNLMFMTAGYLVGQSTDSKWEEFTRKRILGPLGMKRTNFTVKESERDHNVAVPYELGKDEESGAEKVRRIPFRNIDAIGPAGSINSSVRDMSRWVMMLLAKGKFGGKTIARPQTIANVMRPRMVTGRPRRTTHVGYTSYALGWMVSTYRGRLLVQHGGNIDGFSAAVWLLPDQKFGIVVLSNLNADQSRTLLPLWLADRLFALEPVDWKAQALKRIAAGKKRAAAAKAKKDAHRVKGTKPAHPIGAYVGSYVHKGYGTIEIKSGGAKSGEAKSGDTLSLEFHGLEGALKHVHYEVFEVQGKVLSGRRVQFETDVKGKVAAVSVAFEPAAAAIVFDRAPSSRLSDPAFLTDLTGTYHLASQTATVELRKSGKLFVTVSGQPSYECVPGTGLRFHLKGLQGHSVVFELDAKNKAISFDFDQPNGVFTFPRVKD